MGAALDRELERMRLDSVGGRGPASLRPTLIPRAGGGPERDSESTPASESLRARTARVAESWTGSRVPPVARGSACVTARGSALAPAPCVCTDSESDHRLGESRLGGAAHDSRRWSRRLPCRRRPPAAGVGGAHRDPAAALRSCCGSASPCGWNWARPGPGPWPGRSAGRAEACGSTGLTRAQRPIKNLNSESAETGGI